MTAPERHFSFLTIGALRRILRRRLASSLELTNATLDRLEALGPRYNAVAELTADLARKQARAADRAIKRGDGGPLCGIPFGAKDLLATAGIPTTWGAPPYRHQVFDYDATVITRLRDAGAVLVGKLATVELAGGGGYRYASASLQGPGRNPWNLSYWAGGSSSGSGGAVAAGLVPFALGSDTGGSIVIPSSFCGISGLRPSFGIVSRFGVMPLAWSCDKIGPMARSAQDCALVLSAIAGADPRDPTTQEWTYRPRRQAAWRVGVLPNDFTGFSHTRRAFDEALQVLRECGMRVAPVTMPDHDYRAIFNAIFAGEAAAAHEDLIKSPQLDELVDEEQRKGLRAALARPGVDYVRASERRVAARRDLRALFRSFDVLVTPTVMTEATALSVDLDTWRRNRHYGALGPVAGLPGLSIPMGFGATGLPLGLCVIGDVFTDAVVLRVGMAFQRATDWHLRRPQEIAGGSLA